MSKIKKQKKFLIKKKANKPFFSVVTVVKNAEKDILSELKRKQIYFICLAGFMKIISENFNKRELDVLLTSGEQVTSALLAGALIKLGVNSKSWLNWQIPILTEGEHSNARIINMNISKINNFLLNITNFCKKSITVI